MSKVFWWAVILPVGAVIVMDAPAPAPVRYILAGCLLILWLAEARKLNRRGRR